MGLRVVFRADASVQIGTGHIMRCLTLADALKAQGAECFFICREHDGHLIEHVRNKGYTAHALPHRTPSDLGSREHSLATDDALAHAHWLGVSQEADAEACIPMLTELNPEWLIADHYSLDRRWHQALKPYYRRLMVIDDLADRNHECDLLLDQTFGRHADDYRRLVPDHCQILCGSQYALLRPDFAWLRPLSLQRRTNPKLSRLLINMGGVDKDNATGQILEALHDAPLPPDCEVIIVMGATAPWLGDVTDLASDLPWRNQVLVGVKNMAQLMTQSDLAIGAAGATSWERCCLGLPTALVVLADNQRHAAQLLESIEAVRVLELNSNLTEQLGRLINDMAGSSECLKQLSKNASKVTEGTGAHHVAASLAFGRPFNGEKT